MSLMFILCTVMFTSITASPSQLTPLYGRSSGNTPFWLLSQGRISGIQTWGATSGGIYKSIKIKSWTADSKTQHNIPEIGNYNIVSQCPSFSLSNEQYIDGYRVKYDTYVRYMGFHISDGRTFECAVSGLSNLQDTQWKIYNNSKKQLTGFYGQITGPIWAIGFQFTDINYTNNTFTTANYGSSSTFMSFPDEYFRSFDMGRINAVTVWYYMIDWYAYGDGYNGSVMINGFKGDEMEIAAGAINENWGDRARTCDAFTLHESEYINAYRCKYSAGYNEFVYYVGFRTSFSNTYICDGTRQSDGGYLDTGWIMMDDAYLSGLELTIGDGIDPSMGSIMFQFTYLPGQRNTKNPSENPTNNPTNNPSNNPSKNPSNNPSKNPTNNPSNNPSKNPSGNPTNNPFKTPTATPSMDPTQLPTNPSNNPTIATVNPTRATIAPTTPTPYPLNLDGTVVTEIIRLRMEGSVDELWRYLNETGIDIESFGRRTLEILIKYDVPNALLIWFIDLYAGSIVLEMGLESPSASLMEDILADINDVVGTTIEYTIDGVPFTFPVLSVEKLANEGSSVTTTDAIVILSDSSSDSSSEEIKEQSAHYDNSKHSLELDPHENNANSVNEMVFVDINIWNIVAFFIILQMIIFCCYYGNQKCSQHS